MKVEILCLLLHVTLSTAFLRRELYEHCMHGCALATEMPLDFWNIFKFIDKELRCDPKWTAHHAAGLQAGLKSKLFGQHIASHIIPKAINEFMKNDNPQKPLVLSLHGSTGTGKTFVSKLIAESIYKEDSSFVHIFNPDYHIPHNSKIETYKSQLQQWIKGNLAKCARSIFIFDEMDKMHPELIKSIKPFLGSNSLCGVYFFQKAIFIFISNTGGETITQTALDFWKAGRDREKIELKDLETSIPVSAYNNNGGLWYSHLIVENPVDFFIPFLPLEYRHVVQCVISEMRARGLQPDQNVADKMAKDFVYIPETERVFSVRGCKTIQSKLDYYI